VITMKLLQPFSNIVQKRPFVAIAVVVLATLLMMSITIVKPQETEFDDDAWAPEHEVLTAMDDIGDLFPAQSRNVPVLLHARGQSPDAAGSSAKNEANILTSTAMVDILEMEWTLVNDTTIASTLSPSGGFISLPHLLAPLFSREATDFPRLIAAYSALSDAEVQGYFTTAQDIPELGEYVTSLVSTDLAKHPGRARSTIMLVSLDTASLLGESDDDRDDRLDTVEGRIDDVVEDRANTRLDPMVISNSKINDESREADEQTIQTLLPLAFAIIIIILFITFRSVSDLVFSLTALVFTLIWVQGFVSLLGFAPSGLNALVPILLIGLGVDYGIHLTMRYREKLVEGVEIGKAAGVAILSAGAALVLAAFTDMVGFLSNGSSSISLLREFGVTVALGIFSAYVVFVTFVPACRVLLDRRRLAKGKPLLSKANEARALRRDGGLTGLKAGFARGMDAGAKVALSRPKIAMFGITILTLVMLVMATQVNTTFSFNDFLAKDSELTDEILYLQDNFDFAEETTVILIQGDDLAQPEVFNAISRTQDNLLTGDEGLILPQGARGLDSPLTVMRDLADDSDVQQGGRYDAVFAGYFAANDSDANGVPETNIQGLLDYIREKHPGALDDTVHRDDSTGLYTAALIMVKTDSRSGEKITEVHQALKDDARPLKNLENDGTIDQAVVTGELVIMDVIITSINDSMISSILITIVVSTLVLTIVFYTSNRSWTLGIITMLPVVMVLAWILGSMFLLGIPLNVVTILIGAISIGLGVTYAIHVTHRFTEELEEHGDISKAAHRTVKHTGNALLGAAVTTMVGFGILALSPQVPMQQFGTMTAMTIGYSFLVSVFVQPSMLVLWARITADSEAVHPMAREKVRRAPRPVSGPIPATVASPVTLTAIVNPGGGPEE